MIRVAEQQRNEVWQRIKTLKKRYAEPVSEGSDDNKPDPTDPSNGYDSDLSPSLFSSDTVDYSESSSPEENATDGSREQLWGDDGHPCTVAEQLQP